jgi:hypothetical protein
MPIFSLRMKANTTKRQRGIKAVMDRNGIRPMDVAVATGASAAMVSRWRSGEVVPSAGNLTRLLMLFRQYEPNLDNQDLLPAAVAEVR